MEVLKRSRAGETAKKITDSVGIGKTQIQNIIRDEERINKRWNEGESRSILRQVGNVKVFFDKRFLRIELSDI